MLLILTFHYFDLGLFSDNESSTCDAQEAVHDTIGTSIVEWAVGGYNTCVLAYGQTGQFLIFVEGSVHTFALHCLTRFGLNVQELGRVIRC